MQTPYEREHQHELQILNRWVKKGYRKCRPGASKGIVDGIVWNDKEVVFIASQSIIFTNYHMCEIAAECPLPPNSRLIFYWKENGIEHFLDSKDVPSYLSKRTNGVFVNEYLEAKKAYKEIEDKMKAL